MNNNYHLIICTEVSCVGLYVRISRASAIFLKFVLELNLCQDFRIRWLSISYPLSTECLVTFECLQFPPCFFIHNLHFNLMYYYMIMKDHPPYRLNYVCVLLQLVLHLFPTNWWNSNICSWTKNLQFLPDCYRCLWWTVSVCQGKTTSMMETGFKHYYKTVYLISSIIASYPTTNLFHTYGLLLCHA